ncbi:MAG: hypothetical protein ACPGVB_09600, partial [Chitinophagales bacterium]
MKVIPRFLSILLLLNSLCVSTDSFCNPPHENTNYAYSTIYMTNISSDFISHSERIGENNMGSFAEPNLLTHYSHSTFIAKVCDGTAPYKIAFSYLGGFASVKEMTSKRKKCVQYQIDYE